MELEQLSGNLYLASILASVYKSLYNCPLFTSEIKISDNPSSSESNSSKRIGLDLISSKIKTEIKRTLLGIERTSGGLSPSLKVTKEKYRERKHYLKVADGSTKWVIRQGSLFVQKFPHLPITWWGEESVIKALL